MVTLQPISESNFKAVLKLKASDFVAPNDYSLTQAYLSLKEAIDENADFIWCEGPFAIMNNDEVVGFAMITFEDGEDLDVGAEIFWISRVMIDEKHQKKGYGSKALEELVKFMRSEPDGCKAKYAYIAYSPENMVAAKTYAKFGFEETGQLFHDEVVARLVL